MGSHSSDITSMAHKIAFSHHENWDGSCYPNGIKGENIPLAGRIASICDVYDALTSERPYKKAWNQEDAAAFIVEQSGKKFDPVLGEAFIKAIPDINALRDKFSDPKEY